MSRRSGVALLMIGSWLLTIALIIPTTAASAAQLGFSFRDSFTGGDYGGNLGTHDFSGPWWEEDWGGSGKGTVTVVASDFCPTSRCARIASDSSLSGEGLARRADIAEAANAEVQFNYRVKLNGPSRGHFTIAASDGWNWTVLDTVDLEDAADGRDHLVDFDVTQYATKFFSIGVFAYGDWNGALYIDNVSVHGMWVDDGTVTTTEPPTTTTTTTTTTAPPVTTTTTTTTTTQPPATTTTVHPTTTTRAPPPGSNPTTTTPPPTTTVGPTTRPPSTTTGPATTRPPSTEQPLASDARYINKAELALFMANDISTLPRDHEVDPLPPQSPVTQIMATITTTAVTIRSHLLSAVALGMLIAAGAVIGLGRGRQNA